MKITTAIFALLLMMLSNAGHSVRIANIPKQTTIEFASLEILHNRETGGGMLIATPGCKDCTPVSLTYNDRVRVSKRGFSTDRVIDRSQVVQGSVSYDPETLKVSVINIIQ